MGKSLDGARKKFEKDARKLAKDGYREVTATVTYPG